MEREAQESQPWVVMHKGPGKLLSAQHRQNGGATWCDITLEGAAVLKSDGFASITVRPAKTD